MANLFDDSVVSFVGEIGCAGVTVGAAPALDCGERGRDVVAARALAVEDEAPAKVRGGWYAGSMSAKKSASGALAACLFSASLVVFLVVAAVDAAEAD